jgi:RHS repeat-associated protein
MAKLAVRFARDMRGRVVSVGTAAAPDRFARYDHRADGSVAAERLGAGALPRRFTRDALRRLTSLDDPAFSVALGYRVGGKPTDPYGDGRILAEATSWKASAFTAGKAPSETSRLYGFDRFGRLTDAKSSRPTQALAQSYDADGNILSRALGGAGASAFTYGAGTNQLAQIRPPQGAAIPLAHDAAGAVEALGPLALSHDGPGRRPSRVRTASASLAYQAGRAGGRVLKTVSGEGALKRLTIRSGATTLMEVDDKGRAECYVRGPTGLVALVIDGTDHPISRDQRGSVRAAWAGGKAEAAFDYHSFGTLEAENSYLPSPFADRIRRRYTGQEWEEEARLYNYRARLYDPSIARFLSTDPAGQGASPYAYVGGDPINATDPSGAIIVRIVRFLFGKKDYFAFYSTEGLFMVTHTDIRLHHFEHMKKDFKYLRDEFISFGEDFPMRPGMRAKDEFRFLTNIGKPWEQRKSEFLPVLDMEQNQSKKLLIEMSKTPEFFSRTGGKNILSHLRRRESKKIGEEFNEFLHRSTDKWDGIDLYLIYHAKRLELNPKRKWSFHWEGLVVLDADILEQFEFNVEDFPDPYFAEQELWEDPNVVVPPPAREPLTYSAWPPPITSCPLL